MNKVPMQDRVAENLRDEMKRLKSEDRPQVIQASAEAREHGDLKENAEYHAAKERQSFNEGRISEIENKIANAEIIDVSKLSGKIVKFGAKIKLTDEDTDEDSSYQIVGEHEVKFSSGKEIVTLNHESFDRALYSEGVKTLPCLAKKSANWLRIAFLFAIILFLFLWWSSTFFGVRC